MKKLIWLFAFVFIPGALWGNETVSVPWQEFKTLYKESIEKKALENVKKSPWVYSFEDAVYKLTINKKTAKCELLLSGKVISGKPRPIPLFNKRIIIDNINQISGGSLICKEDDNVISFIPDSTNNFNMDISFFVPVQEDKRSCYVNFGIPRAIKNSLSLSLSPNIILTKEPGIKKSDGTYHLPSVTDLTIRFSDKKRLVSASVIKIDTLSKIRLHGRQVIVSTNFIPVCPLPASVIVNVPPNSIFISSSLKKSWIKKLKNTEYQLNIPANIKDAFTMQFACDENQAESGFSFFLPSIKENKGTQGEFILEQPDDGEIAVSENKFVSDISVAKLNQGLINLAGDERFYMRIPYDEKLNLSVKRFKAVSTPPIVLDSLGFFTSFEENGNILSVLIMDIPPEAGSRLYLKAVSEAQIWYLKVNGRKMKVYGEQDGPKNGKGSGKWIIPLVRGKSSHVELAFLRKGEKLGLMGKLEAVLPEVNLPSKSLNVGLALPPRVALTAIEGPVSPAPESSWETPGEFVGKPYYFTRSFHKGGMMTMAVSYKEPAK